MPEDKRPLKVFLCHAHSDKDTVKALYTRLTKDGVDAWLDKEKLLPGQDWELEIREAVREADVVVVCLSKQFNQAGFRQKEVRLAIDTAMEQPEGEIFIIPARLEECDTLESLRKWHWVDLFEDDGYERLIRALQRRVTVIGMALQIEQIQSSDSQPVNKDKQSGSIDFLSKTRQAGSESSKNTSVSKNRTTTIVVVVFIMIVLLGIFGLPYLNVRTGTNISVTELPLSDFSGGTRRIYSSDFSEWLTEDTEFGSISTGYAGEYILEPSGPVYIGSGPMPITPLDGDFVIDMWFHIEERNPSATLILFLNAEGQKNVDTIEVFFTVWDQSSVTYSITTSNVNDINQYPKEFIAEEVQLPANLAASNWTRDGKLTIKREGGVMQFFVNSTYITDFPVTLFTFTEIGVGAGHPSKISITLIEVRVKP
jgi:hypothetical protein